MARVRASNRQAEEVFLVTAGTGRVRLGEQVLP